MSLLKKKKRGLCFILSAASGVGKTTVVEQLVNEHPKEMARVITCTTRKPRGQEKDGVDYRFFDTDTFDKKVDQGEFLEHQSIYGNRYGTLASDVESVVSHGKHAFLVIDVQGAASLMNKLDAVTIFLMPPSMEELEKRIRQRKQDDEKAIELRLSKARSEMEHVKKYDYVVTNDQVEEAVFIIRSIVVAAEHKQIGGKTL